MGMQHGMDRMAPVFRTANAALKIGAGRLMLHAMHEHKAFCACRRRKPPFRRLPLPPPSMPCPSGFIWKPNCLFSPGLDRDLRSFWLCTLLGATSVTTHGSTDLQRFVVQNVSKVSED